MRPIDVRNMSVFDYLELVRRCIKPIEDELKSVNPNKELIGQLLQNQRKNIATVEDIISAKIAEFKDLPEGPMLALNQMIRDGEDSVEHELLGAEFFDKDGRYAEPVGQLTKGVGAKDPKDNVVRGLFGTPLRGGQNDS